MPATRPINPTLIHCRVGHDEQGGRPIRIRLNIAARSLLPALTLAAAPAQAHGFGQRYDLPVPLGLYLAAAAGAVVCSFAVIALFVRGRPAPAVAPPAAPGWAVPPALRIAGQAVAVFLLLLVLAAGWLGNQNPLMNLAPTAVWIIWWVGLPYLSALLGNLWRGVNPWAALFGWAEALAGRRLSLGLHYPPALGVWPGLALLIAFCWIELIYPDAAAPAAIAWLGFGYSLVTWAGMALFGRDAWLDRGEAFSLAFGVFARLSPFSRDRNQAASNSMTALVLFVLASVMFDGLLATPIWASIDSLFPGGRMAVQTVGLVAVWLLFLGAYLAACRLMKALSGGQRSTAELARGFAFTLVPIALAYHLAHYLSFLLIQGQYIIPLASDPFGRGWNLFGSAGWRVDIGIVGARFDWYAAVGTIVAGHIWAVWLAHRRALALFPARRPALRSQYAMTALMVGYTIVSLSILAEPIVETRAGAPAVAEAAPASVAVPADALIPEAGAGLLHQVGPGHTARAAFRFRVLASAFHDGSRMTMADLVYPFSFAWRWSSGADADPEIARATALARERLVGFRLRGADAAAKSITFGDVTFTRELLIVDIYADIGDWRPDDAAAFVPPWSAAPWTVIALMEEAVSRGWAAFSQTRAARLGVPWLDLVRSPELTRRLAGLAAEFAKTGYRPAALASLVSADEARARWASLDAFYRAHGHLMVTNGPYRLKEWSATGATLEAFRDLTYPLGVGSFDNLPIPRRAFIATVEPTRGGLDLSVEIEALDKFQRTYKLVREPLRSLPEGPGLSGRLDLVCRYVVIGAAGEVALAGAADPAADGHFRLALDGSLAPGRYTVLASAVLNGNAVNAEIRRIPYTVPAE